MYSTLYTIYCNPDEFLAHCFGSIMTNASSVHKNMDVNFVGFLLSVSSYLLLPLVLHVVYASQFGLGTEIGKTLHFRK